MTHREWFKTHIDKLKAALAIRPKPAVPTLTLSVFGFSRGAAEAVAFCQLFSDLLENGKLAGIPATINFLGVFDTVAMVGGGYGPGEQGKARGAQSALLSQIPLLHMFQTARMKGVPLKPFSELDATIQDDFQVGTELASAWNAYTAALGPNGGLLKQHMELYYRWRAARLQSLESTASFKAASAQEQQDMGDANRMLAGDLEALQFRSERFMGEGDGMQHFPQSDLARINQWHFNRAQNRTELDDWETWAVAIFNKPIPLPAEVMRFFDDYVHDSFVGFYMAGQVTEYDKRVKMAEVMKAKPEKIKGFDRRVFDITSQTQIAQEKKKAGKPLSSQEETLVRDAENGTPYPLMTDADSADMRSPLIKTQTSTRREGGGYILRRGYYPRNGFIFIFRESIHERELRRVASTSNKKDTVALELVWSDNLRQDIAQARQNGPVEVAMA
ncbi:MAG: hypothetical protein HHJ12_00405 [Glaciimonas sp.]|nr:hypothetical protein [Glaciimonas sp.]